ncbi:MAG: glycosyltransferase family 25 protein [Deferribacteraceae bacterium]|jgi:glycosyl transferase family 25|nr:glycosyltransferase family 25 protein [Deferribacteraceae bacterium]
MRVFAVNMRTDAERRKHILSECSKHSLAVEIIDAVIGKELTELEIKKKVLNFEDSGFTKGEIGCSLSHLNIYQKMSSENIHIALILEDDAQIEAIIRQALVEIEEFDKAKGKPAIYLLTEAEKYVQNFNIPLKSVTLHKFHRGWYTQGYIINLKAAEILLKHLYPVKNYADNWRYILFSTKIKIYTVIPTLITTVKGMESTITADRNLAEKNKRIRYKKKVMFGRIYNIIRFFAYYILKRPFYKIAAVK